jgi:hypothetical protein
MSILKWKIRFEGVLEKETACLADLSCTTIDAFVVRLLSDYVKCLPHLEFSGLRGTVATRVAVNERRYIGSAKLRKIQSIAPIVQPPTINYPCFRIFQRLPSGR